MKIQTQNKLAHFQCEYNELCEQTQMLQAQIPALQAQVQQLYCYLNCNNGDKRARSDYSKALQRLNSLNNTIRRNQMRLVTLSRQIAQENARISNQLVRSQMTANGVRGRSYYGRYTY